MDRGVPDRDVPVVVVVGSFLHCLENFTYVNMYLNTGMARWRKAPSAATQRVAAECPPIGNTKAYKKERKVTF